MNKFKLRSLLATASVASLLLTACGSDDKDKEPKVFDRPESTLTSNGSLAGVWKFVIVGEGSNTFQVQGYGYQSSFQSNSQQLLLVKELDDGKIQLIPCGETEGEEYIVNSGVIDIKESNGDVFKLAFTDGVQASGNYIASYDDSDDENNRTDEGFGKSTIHAAKISHARDFESLGGNNAITLNVLEKNNVAVIDESENFAISCYSLDEVKGTRDSSDKIGDTEEKENGTFSGKSLYIYGKSVNDLSLALTIYEEDFMGNYEINASGEATKGSQTGQFTGFKLEYTGIDKSSSMRFFNEIEKREGFTDDEYIQWSGYSAIGKDSASVNVKTTGAGNGDNANFEFSLNYL